MPAEHADDRGVVVALRPPAGGGELAEDFVACYRLHYPRLVRALELSGTATGDAEDVAQEAFARTLLHWRRVRTGTNPPGYVFRVAFRLRTARRSDERRLAGAPSRFPGGDVAGAEATTKVSLERALSAMPPARRACAVLCLLAGLSPAQAALALRIAPSTVRKQIERARADFRRALIVEEAGADPGDGAGRSS